MENYFEISNLQCSYNSKDTNPTIVLRIEELNIPKGEIVFIVGQSGCGKSTILETLGLMNNTILENNDTAFKFNPPGRDSLDCLTIWHRSNDLLSKIRLDYFSFIFQQTNLMRNFNIYENIAITKMLQGASEIECKRATTELLRNVDLEEFVRTNNGALDKNCKLFENPEKASGGQKQRFALARALVSDYKVLLCDEPTGNLDPITADNIMSYLISEVHKKEQATAVIVSHDLTLATKYGNRIIKIFKHSENDNHYGFINNDSIYIKSNNEWHSNGNRLPIDEITELLRG